LRPSGDSETMPGKGWDGLRAWRSDAGPRRLGRTRSGPGHSTEIEAINTYNGQFAVITAATLFGFAGRPLGCSEPDGRQGKRRVDAADATAAGPTLCGSARDLALRALGGKVNCAGGKADQAAPFND